MSLEYAAMYWLWIDKDCKIVLEQRSPRYGMGEPDVIGITEGRYITEIEIKRSESDFHADFRKIHRINQAKMRELGPRQLYYLMPPDLAEKLVNRIPDYAGLMTIDVNSYNHVKILKQAPVNKESKKLGIKECVRLSRQMTNHMMGYALVKKTINESHRHFDHTDWVDAKHGTYMI